MRAIPCLDQPDVVFNFQLGFLSLLQSGEPGFVGRKQTYQGEYLLDVVVSPGPAELLMAVKTCYESKHATQECDSNQQSAESELTPAVFQLLAHVRLRSKWLNSQTQRFVEPERLRFLGRLEPTPLSTYRAFPLLPVELVLWPSAFLSSASSSAA